MTKLQIPPRVCPNDGFGEAVAFTGAFDASAQIFCKRDFSDLDGLDHTTLHGLCFNCGKTKGYFNL